MHKLFFMGSYKPCTNPHPAKERSHSPTPFHTQPKKDYNTQPATKRSHLPKPSQKRSAHPSQHTPIKKMVITTHSHLQPTKQRLYIPTHTHPHQAKKGHAYPHPPTASQKKVTPTHTQPKNDHTHTHITERMLCI